MDSFRYRNQLGLLAREGGGGVGLLALNPGAEPSRADDGTLAGLEQAHFANALALPPHTIAFVSVPHAANPACQ